MTRAAPKKITLMGTDTTIPEALAKGWRLYGEGRLKEAGQIYVAVLKEEPENANALNLLGTLSFKLGQLPQAEVMLKKAISLNGKDAGYHCNLGEIYRQAGQYQQALDCFDRALGIDGRLLTAHRNRALLLNTLGRSQDALAAFRRVLELEPVNPEARHMVSVLEGRKLEAADASYVAHVFDAYADNFELHLTQTLKYDIPRILREMVEQVAGEPLAGAGWRIMDIGCGTGLCGPLMKPWAAYLTGVDLAAKMLEKARAKNVYDELLVMDMQEALNRQKEPLNLVMAADVLIYTGNLAPLFKRLGEILVPGGLFAASTENAPGGDYVLQPTGRFAHGLDYLRGLAQQNGMKEAAHRRVNVRLEKGQPIPGDALIFRKK